MKILITGARSGIGYLTALTLAEMNHEVYLTCETRNQVKTVKEKVEGYKNITVMKVDIKNETDRKKVIALSVDVLVCNAAICEGGSIIEMDINKLRENFEVNVFSSFELVKEVLKDMIKKDKGRIVMISSLISKLPLPFTGSYSATKASVTNIACALKNELWLMGSSVKVSLVEPGLYHTGFNQVLLDSKYDNGKYFKNIRKQLYSVEHFLFRLFEKKESYSIVVQIVRACLDKNVKKVYRAPLLQSKLIKLYSIFK